MSKAIETTRDEHSAAAQLSGMDRQTLRDWVHRHNVNGVAGLSSRRSPGRPPALNEAQLEELRCLVLAGPDLERSKVVRWRCADLQVEIASLWSVTLTKGTVGKLLRRLRMTRLQPRPYHPKNDAAAQETFKKLPPPGSRGVTGLGRRQADRGMVPDAMRADVTRARRADWWASASHLGSPLPCCPRTPFASPSNSASHRGSSQSDCQALTNRGYTASRG
jgi:putative transposase